MQSDRSLPAFSYSPPLPRTMMLRLHGSPFDRGYLRGTTPDAPACRREWPVPSERILHREFYQIPWYLRCTSVCRRVRPVPNERILHREFCYGGPIGDSQQLVKLGTEERVGDGHRTDRTGLSHYRRSRSLPMWTWTMGEGPLLDDKPTRIELTEQGSSSVSLHLIVVLEFCSTWKRMKLRQAHVVLVGSGLVLYSN